MTRTYSCQPADTNRRDRGSENPDAGSTGAETVEGTEGWKGRYLQIVQFVNVPHCDAMRSAPRCDRAKIVNVGFEAPSVGKMPGPATQRFGLSWLWPKLLT